MFQQAIAPICTQCVLLEAQLGDHSSKDTGQKKNWLQILNGSRTLDLVTHVFHFHDTM